MNEHKQTENRWTDERSTNDGRKKSLNMTKKDEKQNKHTCISEEREMQALMWIKDSYVEMEWCRIWMCCYCVTGLIYKSHSESQHPNGQSKKPGLWLALALHHCCLDKLKGSDSLWYFEWLYSKHEIWLVVSTLWLYCTFSLFGSLDLFL